MLRSAPLFNRRALLATSAALGGASFGAMSLAAPAMAQAIVAPKPTDWVRPPAIRAVKLSPDGMRNVTLMEDNGQKSLVSYNVTTAKAGKIDIGNVQVDSVMWVGNSHVAVVTRIPWRRIRAGADTGSARIGTIYNLDANSVITLWDAVPKVQQGVVSGALYPIQRKGKWLLAATTHFGTEGEFAYLYAVDPDTGKGELLDRGPRPTRNWVVAADGTPVARCAYDQLGRQWAVEMYSGNRWNEVHRVDVSDDGPELLGLGRDGTSVALRLPAASEGGAYHELSASGALSAPLVDDATRCLPVFDPVTLRLIGFTRDDGWPHYEFSDISRQALAARAQAAVPGYRMRLDGLCQNPDIAIVYSEGEDDSGTWYYINFATGQTTQVGAAYPDIDYSYIASKQSLRYAASDGTSIEAYLTLPPGSDAKGLPLVVLPHGRASTATNDRPSRDDLGFDWKVAALAAAGYAVFQPNYRGSLGYGDDFVNAGDGQWGGNCLTDISAGVAKLAADGTIDPHRVAIVGEKSAGFLALASVALQQGTYRCAADIGGYSDLTAVLNQIGDTASPVYAFYSRLFGPTPDAISPARFASSVKVPVFIAHSQDDPDVPYQQGSRMASALKGAGKDVTFVTTKSTDDWQAQAAWRAEVMEPLLAFLARTNPA